MTKWFLRMKDVNVYFVSHAHEFTRIPSIMIFFEHIISIISFQLVCSFALLRDVSKIYLHHYIVNIRGRARTKDLRVQYVIMDLP